MKKEVSAQVGQKPASTITAADLVAMLDRVGATPCDNVPALEAVARHLDYLARVRAYNARPRPRAQRSAAARLEAALAEVRLAVPKVMRQLKSEAAARQYDLWSGGYPPPEERNAYETWARETNNLLEGLSNAIEAANRLPKRLSWTTWEERLHPLKPSRDTLWNLYIIFERLVGTPAGIQPDGPAVNWLIEIMKSIGWNTMDSRAIAQSLHRSRRRAAPLAQTKS
jgi:hypothetical protein